MKIDSGIYMFRNKNNGKVYIGQSKYLHSRYREHKCELLSGTHHNSYFQRAVNAHGYDAFEYSVLEHCPVADLDNREAYYIDLFKARDRAHGYNIREAGNESDLPSETIEKIRISNRGHNSKLTMKEVEQIKIARLSGRKCHELAKEFGVTLAAINKITMCHNWSYIREDLNEKLLALSTEENAHRIEQVKSLYRQGYRPHQIHKLVNIAGSVVKRILAAELEKEKDIEQKVKVDFFNRLSVDEILAKDNVTYAQYKRITKGLRPIRDRQIYEEIIKRRADGELIKDIASSLGLHRGTIKEIIARFNTK